MTREPRRGWRDPYALVSAAAVLAFAAHAASYLYFFVDDEAIPLVYARNLLEGRGLIYTALEGRVEGYSDFLHVIWSTALLAIVRTLGLDGIHVLEIGSAVGFALGIGILIVVARLLVDDRATLPATAGALGFLALAGPLAVWSCSSLEAVPFAFALAALAGLILPGDEEIPRYAAGALAAIVMLERLDGFVYLGILAVAVIAANPVRARHVLSRVAMPALAIGLIFHGGRYLYFGSLVSEPLAAKVLYKLRPASGLITKATDHTYLGGFLLLYGVAVIPAVLGGALAARRSRTARAALLATGLMAIYVQIVGDWMFGWRFVVPILPFVAIGVAAGIGRVPHRLQWAAATLLLLACAASSALFARSFIASEHRPLWWQSPRLGRAGWLGTYADLLERTRDTVPPGTVVAYNQAGLLPFVLDVDNVDDLGICSRFEARLPTTDVYFTEVGRYSPLTAAPVFTAAHAYLLYSDVRVLISRTDLLRRANHGGIPQQLLGGFFRLSGVDAHEANAIYVRSSRDAARYRTDATLFQQNLAHASRVRRVDRDGVRLRPEQIAPSLPYLRWETGGVAVSHDARLDIRFADHDEDVFALYAGALRAAGPVTVTLSLYDEAGRLVASEQAQPGTTPAVLLREFPSGVRARMLSIEARSASTDARLTISDLRVQGQSAALRDYVRRMLKFAPSDQHSALPRLLAGGSLPIRTLRWLRASSRILRP